MLLRALERWIAVVCFVTGSLLVEGTAAAGDPAATPPPSDAEREAARASFREGQRAFDKGDYRRAAEKFEEAYQRARHHAPLWNAARAWQRAGEPVRAANTYAKYLREAPADARDRDNATAALKSLESKVGRIEIHAKEVSEVTVDGAALEWEAVYVAPGTHVIEGQAVTTHEPVRSSPAVAAGATISVALLPTSSATAPVAREDERVPTRPASHSGLTPVVPIVTGAVTLLAAGVTVWSGLDVNRRRDEYLKGERTNELYEAGKDAQLRTNILLAVTGGLALVTVATLFFVDWKARRNDVGLAIGAGAIALVGKLP